MKFEFDWSKSQSNKEKHGIDFNEIQTLWNGKRLRIPGKTVKGEKRDMIIGKVANHFHTVIVSNRKNATRIISARQSAKWEAQPYE